MDLESAILKAAMGSLRSRKQPVIESVKRVVPYDTGSLESTVRIEVVVDGMDLLIGGIQGSVNFVDYHRAVDDRQGFVEGSVIPAIRDELRFEG